MHSWQLLENAPEIVAPRLLGAVLERELNGQVLRAKIVETEAYHQTDAASHSYTGPIEVSAASEVRLYPQSGNFFRPEVATATPDQKKITISHVQPPLNSQPKSRLRQGRTPRTDVMFGPAGHVYVYFTYGMHYCMNVVTGPAGEGSAVLIRAVEPLAGEEAMSQNRGQRRGVELTNGPAKVCQALGVDKSLNGHDLHKAPLKLILQTPLPASDIRQTTRIGITKAVDVPWRFYITGNAYVSRT